MSNTPNQPEPGADVSTYLGVAFGRDDDWPRNEPALHEFVQAALARARQEGAEAMRGACKQVADAEIERCNNDTRVWTFSGEGREAAAGVMRACASTARGISQAIEALPTPPPAAQPQPPAGDEREAFEAWSRRENDLGFQYALRWDAAGIPCWWLEASDGPAMFIQSEGREWAAWQARAAKGGTR